MLTIVLEILGGLFVAYLLFASVLVIYYLISVARDKWIDMKINKIFGHKVR